MRENLRTCMKEGALLGLPAGAVFAAMEIAGAAAMGQPPLMPLRMFASVVLGAQALEQAPLASTLAIGVIAHFALAALFGAVFGLANGTLRADLRRSRASQVPLGLLYGLALWFVNFQIIARLLYPWFLDTPQLLQAAMHVLFYGLPLALLHSRVERRLVRGPRPA